MQLSYSHKFLFIHIPKTAGGSVHRALAAYSVSPENLLINRCLEHFGIRVNHIGPFPEWKRFRYHSTAATVKRHLPSGVYRELFKFAFVRNPWERLVSHYHWVVDQPAHHRHRRMRSLSFAEFADLWTRRGKAAQRPLICDEEGNLLVDFVGHFERLHEDFTQVLRHLGLAVDLPHLHRSSRNAERDYREYFPKSLAALVADRLRDDIQYFGYTLDDREPRAPGNWAKHGKAA